MYAHQKIKKYRPLVLYYHIGTRMGYISTSTHNINFKLNKITYPNKFL